MGVFHLVSTHSAKNLLVRVAWKKPHVKEVYNGESISFYRMYHYAGYYKNLRDHGFFGSECRAYTQLQCDHIIQLFVKDNADDESIAHAMAQEWRHYLQYSKPKLRAKYVEGKKRKELDARKWADKRIKTLKEKGLIN